MESKLVVMSIVSVFISKSDLQKSLSEEHTPFGSLSLSVGDTVLTHLCNGKKNGGVYNGSDHCVCHKYMM